MTTPAGFEDLDLFQRDVFQSVLSVFREYGLATLANKILQFVQEGYDGTTIALLLQDTPEYKQRFAGNEARGKAGLPALSPAEYVATEKAYAQVMRSAGLPAGFYDGPDDFARFIERDVSPQELNERVGMASNLLYRNREAAEQIRQFYPELSEGDLVASLLDPKAALPAIERKVRAAEIGSAAREQGLSTSRASAERYADLGVDVDTARRGYSEIGEFLPVTERIAERFRTSYSQEDAEQEVLGQMASARRKRDQLKRSEVALFRGSGGVQRGSLSTADSGSY